MKQPRDHVIVLAQDCHGIVMVPTNWTDIIAFLVGSLTLGVPVAMPPQTLLG
jgi:hypothetical protein